MGKEFESFNSILDNRYSCRAFLKETVPLDLLEEIIATAQKVPSWCNAQPWQLTLVEGERLEILREKLWEAGKDLYHQLDISFPSTYEGIYKARYPPNFHPFGDVQNDVFPSESTLGPP